MSTPDRLCQNIPDVTKSKLSLNILFCERSIIGDGVRKKPSPTVIPDDYYNDVYGTRLLTKRIFYKLPCLEQFK